MKKINFYIFYIFWYFFSFNFFIGGGGWGRNKMIYKLEEIVERFYGLVVCDIYGINIVVELNKMVYLFLVWGYFFLVEFCFYFY